MDYRLVGVAFLFLVIGAIAGFGGASIMRQGAEGRGEEKVYYIMPVEWTFGIYDENFKPVEKIEVSKGDVVKFIILPSPFIPPEVYDEVEEKFIEMAVEKGLIASKEEYEKYEHEAKESLGREVFGAEFIPHGVAIEGYEDKVNVIIMDGRPRVVTFTADKEGAFDIYCSQFCGWGHGFMRLEGAFVVRG